MPVTGLEVVPLMTGPIIASNSVFITYGNWLSNWWWSWLYWSYHHQVNSAQIGIRRFFLLCIDLAISCEEEGQSVTTTEVQLASDILFLISHPNYPHRSYFFGDPIYDSNGAPIYGQIPKRTHIDMPIDPFYMKCYKGDKYCYARVHPIIQGGVIVSFDLWICQWFWGLVDGITPYEAYRAMKREVMTRRNYSGRNQFFKILDLANGSVKPLSPADIKLISFYNIWKSRLAEATPDYTRDRLDEQIELEPEPQLVLDGFMKQMGVMQASEPWDFNKPKQQ